MKRTAELGREMGLKPCAFTMSNHPRGVLTGEPPLKLTSFEERVSLIKREGIEEVFAVEFTKDFAAKTPMEFAEMIKNEYNAAAVVYGDNYTFGFKGEGWGEYGVSVWNSLGIVAFRVDHVMLGEATVSSTLLRSMIAEGNVRLAEKLLGRYFSIKGEVIKGAQKGRVIGFPTVNLVAKKGYVLPKNGVYLTRMLWNGRNYFGITNVGTRPTFYDDSAVFVECHILDFEGDMYGKEIRVEFLDNIRDEHKFPDMESLKKQISKDKETAYRLIKEVRYDIY